MKRDITIALAVAVIVAGLAFALDRMRPDYEPTPSTPFSTSTGMKTTAKGSGNVVMRVNGEPITEAEFNQFMEEAPEQARSFYVTPEGRRLLADELVKLKALEQEGKRLGVDKEAGVQSQIAMATAQITAGQTLRKLIGAPNEQQVRAEYEKQRAQLGSVQLSHILVAYQGSAVPPRSGQPLPIPQAMARAQQLAAAARGGNFEQVAKSQSDDTSTANQGGHLGDVPLANLPQEVQQVVANMQPGDVSAPVRSTFGIHIFQTGARKAQPYEELRGDIEAKLKRANADKEIQRLQKSAKVELDPKFFPPAKPQGEMPVVPGAPKGQG
ncbi:MAG TPA: peptidylprolyl isomerase [Thermoanaerobaculia bacterium]|nr:peptidylprolyl isomerase [Thermoanaerobaculia bacterium]